MTMLVAFKRPETAAVGCQHFVTDDNSSVFIQTEFKLGICDDDAACQGVISAFFIKRNGVVTDCGSIFFSMTGELLFQYFNTLFKIA